jgi:acetyl esterase/lipase
MTSKSKPWSRSTLIKKASNYRRLAALLSMLDRYFSWPLPPRPDLEIAIQSRVSKCPGSIDLLFFTASSRGLSSRKKAAEALPRPVLINFHGGGFSIGHAVDDARWAGAVLHAYPDAVVVSVNYRLAPEHPFPIALDDGVDAILWLWGHAEQYNLDKRRFSLSGFSAGGNLALTVPFKLYNEMKKPRWKSKNIKLAGLIAFYPSVDWTRTRAEMDATNPISAEKSMISPSVFKFFDDSYLQSAGLPKLPGTDSVDMSHPCLSPGRAAESLLHATYPPAVTIYTCGWDQLLVEGNTFRERLGGYVKEGKMASVGGFIVEEKIHGFDKEPSFFRKNRARESMYGDAVGQLKVMWNVD